MLASSIVNCAQQRLTIVRATVIVVRLGDTAAPDYTGSNCSQVLLRAITDYGQSLLITEWSTSAESMQPLIVASQTLLTADTDYGQSLLTAAIHHC